jgi:hypothetical protein
MKYDFFPLFPGIMRTAVGCGSTITAWFTIEAPCSKVMAHTVIRGKCAQFTIQSAPKREGVQCVPGTSYYLLPYQNVWPMLKWTSPGLSPGRRWIFWP